MTNCPILHLKPLENHNTNNVISYRKQFIEFLSKSVDWFLYDWDIRNYSGNRFAFYSLTSKNKFPLKIGKFDNCLHENSE